MRLCAPQSFQNEFSRRWRRFRHLILSGLTSEHAQALSNSPWIFLKLCHQFGTGGICGNLQFAAQLEPLDYRLLHVGAGGNTACTSFRWPRESVHGRLSLCSAQLAFIFQFELSPSSRESRHKYLATRATTADIVGCATGALLGATKHVFKRAEIGKPLADARAPVHAFVFTRLKCQLLPQSSRMYSCPAFPRVLSSRSVHDSCRGDGHAFPRRVAG